MPATKRKPPAKRKSAETAPDDRTLYASAAKALKQFDAAGKPVTVTVNGKLKLTLPATAVTTLARACEAESDDEMTTQEAADFLNVSRPYLIRLLEEGKLPYRMVGAHRRVRRGDADSFDRIESARRRSVLDALVADGQELGLYDLPLVGPSV